MCYNLAMRLKFQSMVASLLFVALFVLSFFAFAENVEEIKSKINSSQSEIQKIEAEIRKYEKELQAVSKKKKTLKNALYEIDLSRKRLSRQITLTENKIADLEKKIEELKGGVKAKEQKIKENKELLAKMLRVASMYEERSLAEILLSNNFAKMLLEMENIKKLQSLINKQNEELRAKKKELQNWVQWVLENHFVSILKQN